MNAKVNNIKNRLSLRLPQEQSLNILADLAERLTLKKNPDLQAELTKVNTLYPICADFERNFPSICFALATGVGKTRLMGAFISYLYTAKGIKNFFVLAPNITIYDKLIGEFSDLAHPKYVFKGIAEFVTNQPRVITGENYEYASQQTMFNSEVHINVFNISKLNAETRGGKEPRIKRLAECLGESYFDYLKNLPDLVLLMDESHHYRADRGMDVINELNPIIGLELTATPQIERGGKAVKFRNVVYEYSLAKAIRDGFVKEPAVATRRNFDPDQYSDNKIELDTIKLEDGIRLHEDTKVELEIYARDNNTKHIKPFVLVVAKDTTHAAEIKKVIMSDSFFKGYYKDKVMDIHSGQGGEEKDENVAKLLALENPNNNIEIVIHVNMLKEGWDVTNLYTIIPLRASASVTLTEQTIGRGLRLPFGKRTGNAKADKLTIVAHDKFQNIIDEANKQGSIIRKENIITIEEQGPLEPKEVITSVTLTEQKNQEEQKKVDAINNDTEKKKAQIVLDSKMALEKVMMDMGKDIKGLSELEKPELRVEIVEKAKELMLGSPQGNLFADQIGEEIATQYGDVLEGLKNEVIEIPRISLTQKNAVSGFKDFNLDTEKLNLHYFEEEIQRKTLRTGEDEIIKGKGKGFLQESDKAIVSELLNHTEIDYDSQSELLFKLARQAISKLETYMDAEKVRTTVQANKRLISVFIHSQMMDHFFVENAEYDEPTVHAFTKILDHNYSKYTSDKLHDIRETIEPASLIPSKVFTGFKKACHTYYKFDSKTEKDLAIMLEDSSAVKKWLRPANGQFNIYWSNNSRMYVPDFVAETDTIIYLVETKADNEISDADTQAKAKAAVIWCDHATKFTTANGGKLWKYSLIPQAKVMFNNDISKLLEEFKLD